MANNPLTDAALAELDRLHAAATPGEWQINGSHIYGPDPKRSLIAQTLDWPTNSRDAIAALHNAYPALRQRLLDAESRLAEVERERAVVNDMGDLMADVRKQRDAATARAEAAESLVAGLRGALEEARKDNEELDGTNAAHPAWWRGNDAGVAQVCAKINAILHGADVFGTASEPWESTRRRVAEARKDSERLDKVRRVLAVYQDSALGCNPQILFAAVSDAARGTK